MDHPAEFQDEEFSLRRILIDIFIAFLSVPAASIIVKYTVTPYRAGFFCDDKTLNLPYCESTISVSKCYCVSFAIPVLTIIVLEAGILRDESRRRVKVAGREMPAWALRCMRYVFLYTYGMGTVVFLVNVAKITVGRLRPHFFAVCKHAASLCNATSRNTYITNYKCSSEGKFPFTNVSSSFLSGHAAMSFFAAMFVVLYLENRTRWRDQAIVMKTSYELLVMLLAWFTALTRIQNNKHHWGDVLAGSVLGVAAAWFWVRCVLCLRADTDRSSVTTPQVSSPLVSSRQS